MEDQKLLIPQKNLRRFKNVEIPVVYRSVDYRIKKGNGQRSSISVIDTGCPLHEDLKGCIGERVNFSDEAKTHFDHHGHSTIISGIIAANNKEKIVGFAPEADLHFCKVSDNGGECDFNAIVAAVLWSVVKKVDIILMSIGTAFDYTVLHNAIKKAYNANICIFAAKDNESTYPADYPEVLSFRSRPKGKYVKAQANGNNTVFVPMSSGGLLTTIGKSEYTKAYGPSIATAVGTGLAAVIIDKMKQDDFLAEINPKDVYRAARSLRFDG